jgi:hypothetical protein
MRIVFIFWKEICCWNNDLDLSSSKTRTTNSPSLVTALRSVYVPRSIALTVAPNSKRRVGLVTQISLHLRLHSLILFSHWSYHSPPPPTRSIFLITEHDLMWRSKWIRKWNFQFIFSHIVSFFIMLTYQHFLVSCSAFSDIARTVRRNRSETFCRDFPRVISWY